MSSIYMVIRSISIFSRKRSPLLPSSSSSSLCRARPLDILKPFRHTSSIQQQNIIHMKQLKQTIAMFLAFTNRWDENCRLRSIFFQGLSKNDTVYCFSLLIIPKYKVNKFNGGLNQCMKVWYSYIFHSFCDFKGYIEFISI